MPDPCATITAIKAPAKKGKQYLPLLGLGLGAGALIGAGGGGGGGGTPVASPGGGG